MDALQEILSSVGVWSWLREQFPHLNDGELLSAVADDFDGVIQALEQRGPQGMRSEGAKQGKSEGI